MRVGSKCSISLINAEAVIFHQYSSMQGGEEALEGIQLGLGAFNQTISCFIFDKTVLSPWELCVQQIPQACVMWNWNGLKHAVKREIQHAGFWWSVLIKVAVWCMVNILSELQCQCRNIMFSQHVWGCHMMHVDCHADTAVESYKCRCPRAGGPVESLNPHLLLRTIGCRVEHCCMVALMALEEKWTRSAALSHPRHFFMLTLCWYRDITHTHTLDCIAQSFLLKAEHKWQHAATQLRIDSLVNLPNCYY